MAKPEFKIFEMDGMKSLWVDGWNIWQLTKKECTPNVKEAIMHAFFLGAKFAATELQKINIDGDLRSKFEEE